MPPDDRPPPLLRLLGLATQQLVSTLHEHLDRAGFDDQRPGDDPAFAHIPPEGIRLTDLAQRAGVSKQAMSEVVDSLVARGYLDRRPDPADGRAKLIVFADRGWAAVRAALDALDAIERDLVDRLGARRVQVLRSTLEQLIVEPDARRDRR